MLARVPTGSTAGGVVAGPGAGRHDEDRVTEGSTVGQWPGRRTETPMGVMEEEAPAMRTKSVTRALVVWCAVGLLLLAACGDLRLGGGTIATLQEIGVTEGSAVVRGCLHTSMLKVDADGKPVVAMEDPWVASKHTLTNWGDGWIVVKQELNGVPKCV